MNITATVTTQNTDIDEITVFEYSSGARVILVQCTSKEAARELVVNPTNSFGEGTILDLVDAASVPQGHLLVEPCVVSFGRMYVMQDKYYLRITLIPHEAIGETVDAKILYP